MSRRNSLQPLKFTTHRNHFFLFRRHSNVQNDFPITGLRPSDVTSVNIPHRQQNNKKTWNIIRTDEENNSFRMPLAASQESRENSFKCPNIVVKAQLDALDEWEMMSWWFRSSPVRFSLWSRFGNIKIVKWHVKCHPKCALGYVECGSDRENEMDSFT